MTVLRLDHIGIVVDDLRGAIDFFAEVGLELLGEPMSVEGEWVDRVVGLEGVRSELAFMKTPDGHSTLELTKFHSPSFSGDDDAGAPSNAPGIRHILFAVDDVDATVARLQARGVKLVGTVENFENTYRLCYVRGPQGIIVELAQKIG